MTSLLLMLIVFYIGYFIVYNLIGITRPISIIHLPLKVILFIGTFLFFCGWFLLFIFTLAG